MRKRVDQQERSVTRARRKVGIREGLQNELDRQVAAGTLIRRPDGRYERPKPAKPAPSLTQIRFEQWPQNGRPSLMRLGGNRWLKFRETADGFEYMYREGCWRTFKPSARSPQPLVP